MSNRDEISAAFYHVMRKARQTDLNLLHPGLTQSEYFVLRLLHKAYTNKEEIQGEENKEDVYVSSLIHALKVSPQAVSKLLRSLEEKDYIVRTVNINDRRNISVNITEAGIQALHYAQESLHAFADKIIDRMGEENMKELLTLVNSLFESIDEEMLQYQALGRHNYYFDNNK